MVERMMTSSASLSHRNEPASLVLLHVVLTSMSTLLEGDGTVDIDVGSTEDELDTATADVCVGKERVYE